MGQAGIAPGCRWEWGRHGKSRAKRLLRRGERGKRGDDTRFGGTEIWDRLMREERGHAARYPVGHYGPITKTLSARQWAYQPPFQTSLINWEEWEEEEGKNKGMSLYQPSKCQGMGQSLGR